MRPQPVLPLLLLLACSASDDAVVPEDTSPDQGTDQPVDDERPGDEPEDPAPPDDSDVEPPPPVVRFVALGDAGEGNEDQYAVGRAMGKVCAARGCDFAVYLGDNFYDDGVHSVNDDQFQTKFELPYADLDFPFWAVLGNHDFGEIPVEFWRTDYQVEYTHHSSKWTMPDHFYAFDEGHATFIALDTNMIMLNLGWTQNQRAWARKQIQRARAAGQTWVIAMGHHPWLSNGKHGNAGNYEGAGLFDPTGIVDGTYLKNFFEAEFCGKIDFYLSGHDHNRQWLEPPKGCGVELIVSGAGCKLTGFEHRDKNPTVWEDDDIEGFAWIELAENQATVAFYDKEGTLQYESVITK